MNPLKRLFRRRRMTDDLSEEMQQHLEEKIEALVAQGMPREEAIHAARRAFGNATLLEQRGREVWMWPRVENALSDLKYATRQLRKNFGFAVTAILVLALGITASIAIFAFADVVLLQPLPYENPARLVSASEISNSCPDCGLSYADYLDWKRGNNVFRSIEAWQATAYLWKSPAGTKALRAARVSGGFFRTLGVAPMLGRGFTDADDTPGAPRTVLLAYSTWQREFGERRDVLGQSVTLDDEPYVIIGVLPREFQFALRAAEFWTTIHDPGPCERDRSCRSYFAIARLKDGVSLNDALADTKILAARLEKEYPKSNQGYSATVLPLRDSIVGDIRPLLLVLLSGAGLLLLIACVNVASLLLVRTENRRREIALRGTMGASWGRLAQQFVTEAMMLVVFAEALGLAAAYGVVHLLLKLIPERVMRGMPYLQRMEFDWRVLLFAGAIGLFAVAVFSVAPMLRLRTEHLREDLAEGGHGASGRAWKRFGANLVAVELAIAVVLLTGAGLLGKSFYRLLHVELNFRSDHLATMEIDANTGYDQAEKMIALSQRLTEKIAVIPGVVSSGDIRGNLPVSCNCERTWFRVMGAPWHGEQQDALTRTVSVDYFTTLQARLIDGRFFTDEDDSSKPPVIVINRTLAKEYFPNDNPVGRMIGDPQLSPSSLKRIVGVVDDVREGGLNEEIRPALYVPFKQNPGTYFFVVVRTVEDPAAMLPSLVAAVRRVDPDVGVRNEFTMTEHINDTEIAYLHRASAWLTGGFAALALILSIVGLYGVIAYSVSQRTREIGVRMALGAQRSSIGQLILREASRLAIVGIAVGIACSIVTGILMRSLLFGVSSWDLPILGAVAAVLIISALLAAYVPARRAASVDPIQALRAE